MIDFTVVWLDINSSDPKSAFRAKLGNVETFTNVNDCIQYIQFHSNQLIYLIVSGTFAKQIVPEVYESSNLVEIFIYCGSVKNYVEWAMDYCDKLMIFDHGDDLLERLWNELESYFRQRATSCLKSAEEYKQKALQYRQSCN